MSQPFPLEIALLNHASLLIKAGDVRLLTDPWYWGTAFEGGWGLRYDNPSALDAAAGATHLWISHFHEDHLHAPTLTKLVERNPDIVLLANDSYNFDISGAARRIGFKNIVPFRERTPLSLSDGITATRFPTTGVDNMLLLTGPDWTFLNFNDCVISGLAARLLARKIGPVDLFATNFNHAGKLLRTSRIDDAQVKRVLIENFRRTYAPFRPRHVIPFASHHYYRAPESIGQNGSMLTTASLAEACPEAVPLNVGDRLRYDPFAKTVDVSHGDLVRTEALTAIERSDSAAFEATVEAGQHHARKMRTGFGPLARLVPSLNIRIADLNRTVTLRPGRGVSESPEAAPDIECHSVVLRNWLSKTYGTDSFAVGAHFTILSKRKARLILTIATGLLAENKLDARSLLTMLFSRGGLRFLANRREEILGILVSRKVYADYHKD